jgi:hypothetical protein
MARILLPGALAIGMAAAVGLPASASTSPPTPVVGRTITLYEIEKGSTFGFVDNAPKTTLGPHGEPRLLSAGDQIVFSSPVQNAARRPVGRLSATCTVTRAGSLRTNFEVCTGAFKLRGGDLLLAATTKGVPQRVEIAVVGGTGSYVGARGSMVSTTTKTGSTDVIHLLP